MEEWVVDGGHGRCVGCMALFFLSLFFPKDPFFLYTRKNLFISFLFFSFFFGWSQRSYLG